MSSAIRGAHKLLIICTPLPNEKDADYCIWLHMVVHYPYSIRGGSLAS